MPDDKGPAQRRKRLPEWRDTRGMGGKSWPAVCEKLEYIKVSKSPTVKPTNKSTNEQMHQTDSSLKDSYIWEKLIIFPIILPSSWKLLELHSGPWICKSTRDCILGWWGFDSSLGGVWAGPQPWPLLFKTPIPRVRRAQGPLFPLCAPLWGNP